MAIEFERRVEYSKLLNPMDNFKESVTAIEFRTDPLTRDMGTLLEFRWKSAGKPDLSGLIAKSLERDCPFCPRAVEKVTPKFPQDLFPEGRIKAGEAIGFPNALPYVPYSALAVVSKQHFVGLTEFTDDMLADAFLLGQTYLKMYISIFPGEHLQGFLVSLNGIFIIGLTKIQIRHFQTASGDQRAFGPFLDDFKYPRYRLLVFSLILVTISYKEGGIILE